MILCMVLTCCDFACYRSIVLDPANPSVKSQAKSMAAAAVEGLCFELLFVSFSPWIMISFSTSILHLYLKYVYITILYTSVYN